MMAGDERDVEPLSPTSQYFSTSALSVCIIAAFEMEIRFDDDSKAIELVEKLFLPTNPRFSSIMVRDRNGLQHWKKVDVKIEDHVKVPIFPKDLSLESYEERIEDYISNLSMNPFSESRPLWELHNIKYPTTKCDGTIVFKLHHSLGDGFSLMGALFSRLRRADNPSLPLTFPHSTKKSIDTTKGGFHSVCDTVSSFFSTSFHTLGDFFSGLMKSSYVEDGINPIRSTTAGVEFLPVKISTLSFPLDNIQQIKHKIGGTVNDVIASIIFYGTRLYIKKVSNGEPNINVKDLTALVLLNTRAIKTYQTLDELNDPKKRSWGNQFGFLHISIPNLEDGNQTITTPLDFVFKTKNLIMTKRKSVAVYLTGGLLDVLRRFKGPEAAGRYIARTCRNTSFGISNLIGPSEKMEIGGHPVESFYFSVAGIPHSLSFSVVSYVGKMKVAVSVKKDSLNSDFMMSCIEDAYTKIFQEATRSP